MAKVARYRCPPFDLVVEIVRPEGVGDSFLYRRPFDGEVVVEATITGWDFE